MYAFEFAAALSLGLEGLPVGRRPVTRKALEAAGFSGGDLWRYLHRRLPEAPDCESSRSYPIANVTPCTDPAG